MLGKGWFPDQLGGLDRYYRDLLEQLPEARGVVIGPAPGAPPSVTAVSAHDRPLPARLHAFWRAAQRADVDVVDAHFALYALAPLLLGRLWRTPVVLHFQGPWADENVAAGDRSRARRVARRMLERAVYRRADRAVVLTSAFRRVLVERYGVTPWIVHVEPPGVDLARFTPGSPERARARFGLDPEAFVAVSVRRLVPRMGLDVLLDAWESMIPDLPPGSTLLIAGDGPMRESLAERAPDSVRLLGRIGDEDLVELYRAADLGVVPTLEHEGFGLVVIEAAACGTPSVVTAVGGLPEAVAALDPSLIVPAGDARALRARMIRARHDRPGRVATRAYAERFAWPAVAQRHRAIMRQAAARTAGDNRLKVVYVDHVARMSGGEIALLRLLPHLDRVNPHVILAEDGPLAGELQRVGVSVEVLPLADASRSLRKARVRAGGVSPAAAAATAAYVLRLASRLRRLAPQLVHTNSLKAGVYGSVAARLAGVPVVWHVRDRIADDYLPSPAVWLIRSMTRHLATAVVANSRATMATLQTGSDPTVIYSVVPEVMHRVAPIGRVNGRPMTYGIVGRLAPWKGQHLFLKAFARAFPDGAERAVVVGGALFGEDEYARELPGLARRLGIGERVEFRGHRPDVWTELSRLDVLVHASITPEPFGQVILEGMAADVPVIAARAGGPEEILRDEVTGVLYRPNDEGELAAAMLRLRDPGLRARLGASAREEVRRYEPHVVAGQVQRLYEKVAGPRGLRYAA
jgi:glycosyltransferase involved in cell wall biosynthesis